jgi:16S rRNA processing protein RimM
MEWIEIGTVSKPHGIRGAVSIVCSPDHFGVFGVGMQLRLVLQAGGTRTVEIAAVRGTDARPILEFVDLTDRNEAALIRGAKLTVEREALPALEEDEWFHSDLVGCEVFANGALVGVVDRVLPLPANDVLAIKRPAASELLVPLVRDAVPVVDVAAKRVELAPSYVESPEDVAG